MTPTFGTSRQAQEISPFPVEKSRQLMENGSGTPGRKAMGLSRRLAAVSHRTEQEFRRKISEIFRLRILLPWNRRNSLEPTVSCPYCPAWDIVDQDWLMWSNLDKTKNIDLVEIVQVMHQQSKTVLKISPNRVL